MNTIVTFVLFMYGMNPVQTDKILVLPLAEFQTRDGCETVAQILTQFPLHGVSDPTSYSCLSNTESHTLAQ